MHLTQRPGQTLLEAIVAIAVILSAVIGSTTLIISSITAGRISQNRVEAANFAREGVEVVRGLRDSNWLKIEQNEYATPGVPTTLPKWNSNLGPIAVNIPTIRTLSFSPSTSNSWVLQDCVLCGASTLPIYLVTYIDPATTLQREFYGQYNSAATCNTSGSGRTCVATKYSRKMTLTLKPEDINNDGTTDPDEAYLLVESLVTWNDRTGAKSLSAQARLYDWK